MRRLRTVHGLLQEANGLGLLADPLMERATAEILAGARPRHEIQRDIKQKERAREMLVRKYKSSALPEVWLSAWALMPCATAPCGPSCWRLSFMVPLRAPECTLYRNTNKYEQQLLKAGWPGQMHGINLSWNSSAGLES